ncbi:8453_t:CDS:2, partial [Dentiscutata erythropus]
MQETQNEVTVEIPDSITQTQDQRNIQPPNTNNTLSSNSFQIYLSEHLHISLHFVAELSRTIIAAICFVIIGFFCTFAIQWSDYRWKTSEDDMKALVDLGFETIPETEYIILADLFMLSLLVGSVSLNLILAESSIARLIIVRRIFWMLCFLLFFRMITLSVTTLPSPKPCIPMEPGNFLQMLKNGVDLITGSAKACTDNIFSGHSIFITTRAEDRLGDKDLYQRIAYMPNMFNISLVGAVRWMDGLDIRFTCEGEEILDATRERARRRRLQNSSDNITNSEMTEVEIIVNPSQDDVE